MLLQILKGGQEQSQQLTKGVMPSRTLRSVGVGVFERESSNGVFLSGSESLSREIVPRNDCEVTSGD